MTECEHYEGIGKNGFVCGECHDCLDEDTKQQVLKIVNEHEYCFGNTKHNCVLVVKQKIEEMK